MSLPACSADTACQAGDVAGVAHGPVLERLGCTLPVLAAPMAGGPTTPALVHAAAAVGSAGFLAGGYRAADDLAANIEAVRAVAGSYGVNLFAPNPVAQF